jgi:preprotein translocase subunit SecE
MARIRPARGQGSSGDGSTPPPPGGARTPAPRRKQPQGPKNPKPAPQSGKRKTEKTGSVTKAVAQQRRGGGSRFIKEVIAELKKVSWPTRSQLAQSTAVVLVVVAIVAVYLAVLDSIFDRLVSAIF